MVVNLVLFITMAKNKDSSVATRTTRSSKENVTPSTSADGTGQAALSSIDTSGLSEESQLIVDKIVAGLVSYFQNMMDEKDEELNKAKSSIVKLEKRVSRLEDQLDNTEAYSRRDCLVISGQIPEVRENENCTKIVQDLLRDVNLNVSESEISTAHRLGKNHINGRPDRRSIIFKLCRRDMKKDIMYACRQMKPPYYVNESLTPTRSAIMYVLRKAKREHPDVVSNARTLDGNVHVWVHSNNDSNNSNRKFIKTTINTRQKLDDFLQEKLSCGSERFINRWPDINI